MKKSLVALAALAVVGAASAQSTATVSGLLQFGVGTTKFGSNSSGPQIVRSTGNIAFKGTEDLGGGLKANFEVQTTLVTVATTNVTTSVAAQRTLLGDRGTYVNLQGDFGTVQVGRSNSAVRGLWGAIGDVSGIGVANGLSAGTSAAGVNTTDGGLDISAGDTNARVIYGDAYANQVNYVSPSFNGVTFAVGLAPSQYTTTGVGNSTDKKDTYSYTAQYAAGPIVAAYNLTDNKANGGTATTYAYKMHTALASYDLGIAKFGLTYQAIKMSAGIDPGDAVAFTANVPFGGGNFGLGYGRRSASDSAYTGFGDDVKELFVGYKYALSKRTNVQLYTNKINRSGSSTDLRETHVILSHAF